MSNDMATAILGIVFLIAVIGIMLYDKMRVKPKCKRCKHSKTCSISWVDKLDTLDTLEEHGCEAFRSRKGR